MKEGFLIGGGLILIGLMLQVGIGSVDWTMFAWPVNVTVLAATLLMTAAMYLMQRSVYAFRFLATFPSAVPAMAYAVALTIVMGLTRQSEDGTWTGSMLTFWPFVLIYAYMAVILGLVAIRQLTAWASARLSPKAFRPSLLLHLGLFIAMTTATLGNADMRRMKMVTALGETEWRAFDQQGNLHDMPIAIRLDRFILETYDNGTPRRFASDVYIYTKSGKELAATVDVNKPVEIGGWKIYQSGYDTQMGAQSDISILELVKAPWLPLVYTGIYMMLAGAALMFILGASRRSKAQKQ